MSGPFIFSSILKYGIILFQKNLNIVSQVLEEFNLKAFLIEPDILQDLVIEQISGNSSFIWNFAPQFLKSSCRYVCGKPSILIGVFDDQWTDMRVCNDVYLMEIHKYK